MIHPTIAPTRIRYLNDKPINSGGRYVLYWMQQAHRTHFNHALAYAIERANELKLPVIVGFGLMDDYPEATERHYAFMLEGLADVEKALTKMNVGFVVRHGQPKDVAALLSHDAAVVICDRAYLRHLRAWREHVADEATCQVVQVETETVVPVNVATDKPEIGARTLRPRIHRQWSEYLVPVEMEKPVHSFSKATSKHHSDFDLADISKVLSKLKFIRDVKRSAYFKGGQTEAGKKLRAFVDKKLKGYADGRNEPAGDQTSLLSPYLQYGQISPIEMALSALAGQSALLASSSSESSPDRASFIEELIVRRELAHNYCEFNKLYDSFEAMPNWAKASLAKHAGDKREHLYTREQLEQSKTHDPYWNAAMAEAVITGYMHNYMRMYWGKKLLEWSPSAQEAYDTTLYLNNRFFLCGLNANTYGNVAWIFGQHDRPWGERAIFGNVRYMNAAGLERKFDIDLYVAKIAHLTTGAKPTLF